MPTRFPNVINNFELTLARPYMDPDDPTSTSEDNMALSADDMARIVTALANSGYTDPYFPQYPAFKFTLIHPDALDANGHVIDPTKTKILLGLITNPTSNLIEVTSTYSTGLGSGAAGGFGFEGATPPTAQLIQPYPTGSFLRCEPTAGLFLAIFKAINNLEAKVGTELPN